MEFKIEYDKIIAIVEEEVSREGAQAYSADGASLYDGIRMLSRDEDKKKRLMSEVLVSVRILSIVWFATWLSKTIPKRRRLRSPSTWICLLEERQERVRH